LKDYTIIYHSGRGYTIKDMLIFCYNIEPAWHLHCYD